MVFATQAMHDAHVGRYVMWDRKEKLGHKDKAWVMKIGSFSAQLADAYACEFNHYDAFKEESDTGTVLDAAVHEMSSKV